MDFLGGALPNVMFIVGMLAIGLGLGIELKLVPLNKEIDKTGRIGAMIVGAVLVAGSLYIYLNPSLATRSQPAASANAAVLAAAAPTAAPAATSAPAAVNTAPTIIPTATSAPATEVPTATPLPTDVPTATPAPTATKAPTATPAPTAVPPTELPKVVVPDLHDTDEMTALHKLQELGLKGNKLQKCSGTDQGEQKIKKGRVQCQNPAAGQAVAPGTSVDYVLAK
jgi:hypothetical protein